jgi:uncharacterized membrane protein
VLVGLLKWIYDLSISQTIRSSFWIFPFLEYIHLYSMVFLVSVIAAFNLRLMGFRIVDKPQSLSKLSRLTLVLASVCFGVNFVTGLLLFGSKSTDYYLNSAFRVKLLLILVAVAYHSFLFSWASKSEDDRGKSLGPRFAGFASLLLWIGVIAASRWIAFV